ncbi:hypothetical protein [Solitalea lacus]|uniref:hypothetical protein n=1 Tax=Solitalea lacus TaxID=2911172 RepID=UPI001EDA58B0|nr:hypothetical protein [Solitalea lacus]UKJ07789.1 hypothetical protein L2B55_01165 [Solitalea lacus]
MSNQILQLTITVVGLVIAILLIVNFLELWLWGLVIFFGFMILRVIYLWLISN